MRALERVVVLPWNEFYTDAHVDFVAAAVRTAVRSLVRTPSRRVSYAVFSCDLDTVDRHLQGYGFEDLPPCDLIYRTAVPRLLELLDELGVPAVLFTIGRDAETQRDLLRRATAAGHEIASHSLTHPQPFSTLDDAALREQLEASRAAPVGGGRPRGRRVPGAGLGRRRARARTWCARRATATTRPSSRPRC